MSNQVERWNATVAKIRAHQEMRDQIIRSVTSSMELSGFEIDREESERLFDEVLDGPPLVFEGI